MDIIANLKAAIAAVEAEPETQISLDCWMAQHRCGTLHCIGGLCAVTPHFTEQGMYASGIGAPTHDSYDDADPLLDAFFGYYNGEDAYSCVFSEYGTGAWDKELLAGGRLTHKELALARLHKALAYQQQVAA